tara:strand:- start:7401 stop:7781 length:381 start_codon:yes stop_codon:yes gene_type:complete
MLMHLTEKNFMIYAAKHYDIKRSMSEDEFQEDLKRFQYLKRLFKRYEEDDDLRVRLILNHIIVIYNCFGPAATSMLFLRLEEYKKPLKTFLLFLSYMPDNIEYNDVHFKSTDIAIDNNIAIELRKL